MLYDDYTKLFRPENSPKIETFIADIEQCLVVADMITLTVQNFVQASSDSIERHQD